MTLLRLLRSCSSAAVAHAAPATELLPLLLLLHRLIKLLMSNLVEKKQKGSSKLKLEEIGLNLKLAEDLPENLKLEKLGLNPKLAEDLPVSLRLEKVNQEPNVLLGLKEEDLEAAVLEEAGIPTGMITDMIPISIVLLDL